jgi:hypothetical protein
MKVAQSVAGMLRDQPVLELEWIDRMNLNACAPASSHSEIDPQCPPDRFTMFAARNTRVARD